VSNRWKYKTATVTVEENTITVRGLTAGERESFSDLQKKNKAGEGSPQAVARAVVKFGCTDNLSDEDVHSMPGDLLDAACAKIFELSGVKGDETEKKDDPVQH
jgi:hypothetical protein